MHVFVRCGVIIWAKFGQMMGLLSGPSMSLKKLCGSKTLRKKWFQHIFKEVQLHNENSGVIIWAKFTIFMLHKLGPENGPYLAKMITPQNGHFGLFCL